MCYSEGKREKLWSLFFLSFTFPFQLFPTEAQRVSEGSFPWREGQVCGCSTEIQQPEFPLGLTEGICCAKVVCVIVLVINFHPLENQSSLASESLCWIQKERILRWLVGSRCSRKYKVIAIDVEGNVGTSFIREQTESPYTSLNVLFVNWAQL